VLRGDGRSTNRSEEEAEMTLEEVKEDYEKERTVLLTWQHRMDISTLVTEVPPENLMSAAYKEGWNKYLDQVVTISDRMIAMCTPGNEAAVQSKLLDEANKYADLATSAGTKGLMELKAMLEWEAQSRRDVADSLGVTTPMKGKPT
jgi:hypothetical protein